MRISDWSSDVCSSDLASGDEWLHCLCPLIPNGDVEPRLDQLHRERCALIAKADKANPFRCCIRHFWIPRFMPAGPPTGIVGSEEGRLGKEGGGTWRYRRSR